MRILLLGEYSRLHLSLAEGLCALGHEVTLASDGDGLKNYARDIDLTRKSSSLLDTVLAIDRFTRRLKDFKDYDVVQIINPCFLTLSVAFNRYFFGVLKKKNKKIFLGAFGDDSFWVRACKGNQIFKYSEFFVDGKTTNLDYLKILEDRWLDSSRERLNNYIAKECDGIISCLYEYYKSYEPLYSSKLCYIPLPVNIEDVEYKPLKYSPEKIKFFLGIIRSRAEYKGTDLMEKVLTKFVEAHPNDTELAIAESLSYEEYKRVMQSAHVVLDQLYSHSPAMNALLAMAQGKLVISGGEPEIYDLMGDVANRPVINVYPTEQGIWDALEKVLQQKNDLEERSLQGRSFVSEYHNHVKIAEQYLDFWQSK